MRTVTQGGVRQFFFFFPSPRPAHVRCLTSVIAARAGGRYRGTNGMWTTDPSNPTFDAQVHPPWGLNCSLKGDCKANPCPRADQCPTQMRHDYQYDDPSYNWRALRVINGTDDFTFVQWDPEYNFGVAPKPITPGRMMPGVNIVGQDSPHPCPAAPFGNRPVECEAVCKAKQGCVGWTLHLNPPSNKGAPGWRCCTKITIDSLQHAPETTTSGVLDPGHGTPRTPNPFELANASGIAFSEYYDLRSDPWQLKNLWPSLTAAKQAALMTEIAHRFACRGTRTSPSTCE